MYKCLYCNEIFEDDDNDYDELLWGHIQLYHEEVFERIQDWDTPWMLEECFEEC